MPGYVAIGVKDLSASRRFWCEGLGLPVQGEWPGQRAVGAGGFEILLDATGEIPVSPGIEVAIASTRSQIDAASARVRPFRGPKDFGGPNGIEAAFRDPDGYGATLFTGRS
jgi:catechol 2,3-dioxygenase-like lactoylglutathione lyase family enzyme